MSLPSVQLVGGGKKKVEKRKEAALDFLLH